MRKILIGAAAATAVGFAAPAGAQRVFTPDMDEELVRAVPPPGQVEEIAEAMDRVLGAVLQMPVGPLVDVLDAADPNGRPDRRYRRGETVGDVASRDDPYFEERLRDSVHGSAGAMSRTMEQVAIVAPVLRRALGEMERSIGQSIEESRERTRRDREERERGRGR